MAGSKSNYLESEILDHVLGGDDYVRPATVYIALFSAATESSQAELSGNGYARVAVTNNATEWPAAVNGSKSNANAIAFPEATGSSWLAAVAFGIYDASSSGNLLYWGDLTSAKTAQVGDVLRFQAGSLTISED